MTSQELIQKFLPQDLWEVASNYNIPSDMLENNGDLVNNLRRITVSIIFHI